VSLVYQTDTSLPPVNGTKTTPRGWLVYTEEDKDAILEDGLHVTTIDDNGFNTSLELIRESTRLSLKDELMQINGSEASLLHTVKMDDDGCHIWSMDVVRYSPLTVIEAH